MLKKSNIIIQFLSLISQLNVPKIKTIVPIINISLGKQIKLMHDWVYSYNVTKINKETDFTIGKTKLNKKHRLVICLLGDARLKVIL